MVECFQLETNQLINVGILMDNREKINGKALMNIYLGLQNQKYSCKLYLRKHTKVENEFERVNLPLLGFHIYNNFGYITYIVRVGRGEYDNISRT